MILLVNPYIYDFSAYDMWMMPLGLLHSGSILKKQGYDIHLIDLLSVDYDTKNFGVKRKPTGDGKLPSEVVEKPKPIKSIPKKYKRYGIPEDVFINELKKLPEKPQAIFVTSKMTYWYPGVSKTISTLKEFFPKTKIVLGGTYAKLLPEHAKNFSGADFVITDESEKENKILYEAIGIKLNYQNVNQKHYEMDLSLLKNVRFLPLLSSTGCPFNCTYCASAKLFQGFKTFTAEKVTETIIEWQEKFNVIDIVIFDDAFLVDKKHAKSILNGLIKSDKKFRIHAPNALHARYIDTEMAELMRNAGFYTIRLGLESTDVNFQKESGAKVFNDEFLFAVRNLHKAGYKTEEIGVYVMCGLPFQKKSDVVRTIEFVIDSGAKPKLVEYSPVPGTPLFEIARRCSPYNLEEPLFHNNSILPCQWDGFTYSNYVEIKELLQKNRSA